MAFLSAYSKIRIFTATTTFIGPYDWNPLSNLIAALGAGSNATLGGISGAGGAFSWSTNLALTIGTSYAVTVPAANAGDASFGNLVIAKGATAGTGGAAASGTGQHKFSGGNGTSSVGSTAGGGGGAAGPSGNGGNASGIQGGFGDNGVTAAPSGVAASGIAGTEFDATHGCGSGGNGRATAGSAGPGGAYGAGGANSTNFANVAAPGLVIVAYNPLSPPALFLGM